MVVARGNPSSQVIIHGFFFVIMRVLNNYKKEVLMGERYGLQKFFELYAETDKVIS